MRLLIIGDENSQISKASLIAKNKGAKVTLCKTTDEALETIRSGRSADLVMVDVNLSIKEFISSLKAEHINTSVVCYGFDNDSEKAVNAIKAGAKEYIQMPPDEELIAAMLEAVTEEKNEIIANSLSMQKVINIANQIAPSEASVLITGESGTGKEIIARYIHSKSKRNNSDMVSVNCAAIPDNLLESELFGHEKGAFTGAVARRVGKFEEANNSTLLLDEISEMDVRLQAKLLRAIQEREIDRVGGSKPVPINIRIIATSNRDLAHEVKEGNFREDLLFRLNVIQLHLPPLRERKDDIIRFAKHFITTYSKLNQVKEKPLTEKAIAKLNNYSWPGNVRELENTMHRAVLLAVGEQIDVDAIILSGQEEAKSETPDTNQQLVGRTIESVEKELIIGTLDQCLGNRTHAAKILGISIRTLRNKLNAYAE